MGNILEITETRPTVQVTEAGNTLQVVAPNSIIITDVTPTVTVTSPRPQVIVQNAGIQGPIGLNWRGAWSLLNSYLKSDAVHYGGSCYYCIADVGANAPGTPSTDTIHWNLLVSNGATGVNWRGAWSILGSYAVLDAVEYLGSSFICTTAVSGNNPPPDDFDSNSNWDLLIATAFAHKGDYDSFSRYKLNETVLYNGQMWRSASDRNAATPPAHPFENTANWQYVSVATPHMGTYDENTLYYRNEIVDHLGSSYICKAEVNLADPPDTLNWNLMSNKGDQGVEGLYWQGAWNAFGGVDYIIDDAVSYAGSSWICIQAHTGSIGQYVPNYVGSVYWEQLASMGDIGPASTVPGPNGGALGDGYIYDDTTSGGSSTNGSCRFNNAVNLTIATKCWLADNDKDGNDLSEYILSFADTTSTIKCHLTIAASGDNQKFLSYTIESISSGLGFIELTLTDCVANSSNTPFTDDDEVVVGMFRTGDRGTVWKGAWSSATAYILADSVSHGGSSWICIQAGTDHEPLSGSSYWEVLAEGGASSGAGTVGSGYKFDTAITDDPSVGEARFNASTFLGSTKAYIHEEDLKGGNNEKLFVNWIGSNTSGVMGYLKLTSKSDPTRWAGCEITRHTPVGGAVHELTTQNHATTLVSRFDDEELITVSLVRAGDAGLNWRDTYDHNEAYAIDDAVHYNSRAFVCVTAHDSSTGEAPKSDNSGKWRLLTTGFEYRGDWSSEVTYNKNDIVLHDGSSYICTVNGTEGLPQPQSNSGFSVFVSKGDAGEDGSSADMPIGSIIMWVASEPPDESWKICDGSSLLKDSYETLSDLLDDDDYPYGSTSTHFNIPDMRQQFPVGRKPLIDEGSWATTLGVEGGASTVILSVPNMPSHTHGVLVDFVFRTDGLGLLDQWQRFFEFDGVEQGGTDPDTWNDLNDHENTRMFRQGLTGEYDPAYAERYDEGTGTGSPNYLQEMGGGQAHENKPPFVVINYIIKVQLND